MKLKLFLAVIGVATATFADDPKVGDTWYVSTENLTLRTEPDALSKAVKNPPYRTAAKVKGVVRVALPFNGDKEKFPDTLMPNWVKLLGAAASAGSLTSGMIYSEIGPVQEYQLGLAVASRILPLYPPVAATDPAAQYVTRLGAVLAAASNDPTPFKDYSFILVKSDEVNAFAVPGGFVFVTTS